MPVLGRLRLVSSTKQDFVLKTQHNKIPIWNGKYIINTYIRSLNKKINVSHLGKLREDIKAQIYVRMTPQVSSLQTTALGASPLTGVGLAGNHLQHISKSRLNGRPAWEDPDSGAAPVLRSVSFKDRSGQVCSNHCDIKQILWKQSNIKMP